MFGVGGKPSRLLPQRGWSESAYLWLRERTRRLIEFADAPRLRVRSDEPIAVMSLLETPTGHLTNISTGTAN